MPVPKPQQPEPITTPMPQQQQLECGEPKPLQVTMYNILIISSPCFVLGVLHFYFCLYYHNRSGWHRVEQGLGSHSSHTPMRIQVPPSSPHLWQKSKGVGGVTLQIYHPLDMSCKGVHKLDRGTQISKTRYKDNISPPFKVRVRSASANDPQSWHRVFQGDIYFLWYRCPTEPNVGVG